MSVGLGDGSRTPWLGIKARRSCCGRWPRCLDRGPS